MTIEDEHIREAERILIDGTEFDTIERIPFIKNLNSCDLLAVPGSGKTTALLAKLYCLSKQLPFKDGSGILVLSHTNVAVDEIENNLKPYCPKLFDYPNFVGTVQGFVNKFLANPACFLKHGAYLSIVDDEVANKLIINKTKSLGYNNALTTYFFFQTFNQSALVSKDLLNEEYNLNDTEIKDLMRQLRSQKILNNGSLVYSKVKNNTVIDSLNIDDWIKKIVKDIAQKAKHKTNEGKDKRGTLYTLDFLENKFIYQQSLCFGSDSGSTLLELYVNNFINGIARYRDCYSLGDWYLQKYPGIKSLLQERFKYVFIDEMQDLEKFQIDMIDKIFLSEGSATVIQRIGDINQAIYNSGKKIKVEADWKPRHPMYLNGSNRLTSEVANVVNSFTLDKQKQEDGSPRFVVNGLKQLEIPIKPHLILFDNKTIGLLKNQFRNLIEQYALQKTKEAQKYGFKIIGWNAKWDDDENHDGKLRLENIFKAYKKEASANKENFDSLSKYIQLYDYNKVTLDSIRKNILNSLIHILRLSNKTYSTKIRGREVIRYYSKSEMIDYVKSEENGCDYELFKRKLYEWTFKLAVNRNFQEVYVDVKSFIESDFKNWFGFVINTEVSEFIGRNFNPIIPDKVEVENSEAADNSIKIDIGTVHSAKGQTYCATLYVETAYQRPAYESKKVIKEKANPLLKQQHRCTGQYDRQALKMMYVGFSRPTHLLCFAALKENIGNDSSSYIDAGWEVEDLTNY
jgi:hypothetical protein